MPSAQSCVSTGQRFAAVAEIWAQRQSSGLLTLHCGSVCVWGPCSQTHHSLSPPAQCANSIQKHMSLLSEPPLWSLSCLLCLGRSQSALGWPRCSTAPYFVLEAHLRAYLISGAPPNLPTSLSTSLSSLSRCSGFVEEQGMSRVCGEQGQRPKGQEREQLCRGVSSPERALSSRRQQHLEILSPQSSPNSASVWSGPQGGI